MSDKYRCFLSPNSYSGNFVGCCGILLLLLLNGCANIVTPSGGDKDVKPPEVLEIEPENQSLNFDSKSFVISFDEYVQLNDISSQLIVSPPLKTPPQFVVKGKKVFVKFNSELEPNTTYTMNFGSAIRDVNESNPLESFTYVFSTGSFIDSLSLRGSVKNANTLEAEKDVLVLLYNEYTDSVPYLKLPYYYAKTDASGNFALNNLKEGKYKVVALKDVNSSFLYDDFDKELIGFADTLVFPFYIGKTKQEVLKDSLPGDSIAPAKKDTVVSSRASKMSAGNTLSILVFKEEKNRQYLKKAYAEHYGKLVFVFNKKPEKPELNTLNTSFKKEWSIMEPGVTGDTLTVWLSDVDMDSLRLEVSDNGVVLDTVFLALKKRSDGVETQSGGGKRMGRQIKPFELALEAPGSNFTHNPEKDLYFTFNHPVKNYVAEQFLLTEENDTVQFTLDSDDPFLRKFKLVYSWKEEKEYSFLIPPQRVTDIFDLQNDSIKLNFKTKPKTYYGNVLISLSAQPADYVLQLTDESNNIVYEKQVRGSDEFSLRGLDPKSYGMRLIVDENSNGKWDTGNYLQKKQPEKIILYPQKINVRSNWDVEIEWEVN